MVITLSTEKDQLQKQVQYYSERFEDFNDTLTKSNEAISSFSEGVKLFLNLTVFRHYYVSTGAREPFILSDYCRFSAFN